MMKITHFLNTNKKGFVREHLPLLLPFFILSSFLFSFTIPPPSSLDKKENKIILEYADMLSFDKTLSPDIQKLVGNVCLKHNTWLMYCDSANFNEKKNQFEAFGNIKIYEGDSISIFSKHLFYDGNTEIAYLTKSVELHNKNAVLYTERLDYDRNKEIGYYTNYGIIVDSLNTLSSIYGEYTPNKNEAFFKNKVTIKHPKFNLTTDSLRYNTEQKIAFYQGKTLIKSDTGRIESSKGVYDTQKDIAILLNRSTIFNKKGSITGDSIFYDKPQKFSEVFGHFVLLDTVNHSILEGDYGYFDESKKYVFATQKAILTDYSKKDSLFIGADTLEIATKDIQEKEVRLSRGYHNVRLFRKDIQASTDSIHYFSLDSVITLYNNPLMWQDSTQISSDTIRFFLKGDSIDKAVFWNNAKVVKLLEKDKFEQLKGDTLIAFFTNQKIHQIDVLNKTEMIYYALQESIHHYYALSRIKADSLSVYIKADTLEKIIWKSAIEGKLYPIEQVTDNEKLLGGKQWDTLNRPLSPKDLHPKQDSLISKNYSNQDYSQFKGAIAAYNTYTDLEASLRKYKKLEIKNTLPPSSLSIFITRNKKDTLKKTNWIKILTSNSIWDSFSSTITEGLENSITHPSTGILKRNF